MGAVKATLEHFSAWWWFGQETERPPLPRRGEPSAPQILIEIKAFIGRESGCARRRAALSQFAVLRLQFDESDCFIFVPVLPFDYVETAW